MIPSTTARSAILGIPLDTNKQPSGSGVVQAIEELDLRVIANSAGAIIKNSLSNLNAATSPTAGAMAWVIGDATVSNNGVYENTGTSVSPVWTRRADLPFGIIPTINVGAGTANAVSVTSSIPIPSAAGSALVIVTFLAANTGSMTLSVNAETPRDIVLNGGGPVPADYVSGNLSALVSLNSDGDYQLYTFGDPEAVQAAVEAGLSATQNAQAEAEAAAALAAQRFVTVRLVDTSEGAPATAYEAGDTIDGVTLASGDLILRATNGGDPSDGVYVASASGAASRASLFGTYDSLPGAYFSVMEGDDNEHTLWHCTSTKGGTLGVTDVTCSKFSAANATFNPADYGCAMDGTTDDATALNAMLVALDSLPGHKTVDLHGQVIRIDSTITGIGDVTIQNGSIDFSNAPTSTWLFKFEGTLGTGVAITAAARGANAVLTANTGTVAARDWIYLRSTSAFGQGGTHNGEFAQVKSVVANTSMAVYSALEDLYSGTPQYFHPTLLENIILRDLDITGGGVGSSHKGARFYLCNDVLIDNVKTRFIGERSIQFERSIDCVRRDGGDHHIDQTGLAYGTVIGNGCYRASVIGGIYSDQRHAVTVGGEDGVDWHVAISGLTATDCRDSAIDCHPQAAYVAITGCSISHLSNQATTDGIVVQCANPTITGNNVHGASRIGILVQNLVSRASRGDDVTTVVGNMITFPGGALTTYGITIECQRATALWRFVVSGNIIDNVNASAAYGIWVEVPAGVGAASIQGGSITGNTVYTRRNGISLVTSGTQYIALVTITGNSVQVVDTSTYDAIVISAATSGYIERIAITSNTILGGRYGIANSNGTRIGTGGNMIQGFGTGATNGALENLGTNFSS